MDSPIENGKKWAKKRLWKQTKKRLRRAHRIRKRLLMSHYFLKRSKILKTLRCLSRLKKIC